MGILINKVAVILSDTPKVAEGAISLFAEHGAHVTLLNAATPVCRDPEGKTVGDRTHAHFLTVNIDQPESIEVAAKGLIDRHGRLDCIFNVLTSFDLPPLRRRQNITSTGYNIYDSRLAMLLRIQLPVMLSQGFGSIVFAETSVGARTSGRRAKVSKNEIAAIIRQASWVTRCSGVRINVIRPRASSAVLPGRCRESGVPLTSPSANSFVDSGFSQAALFLLSDLSSLLNGLVLTIDA